MKPNSPTELKRVVVTGANGFLGSEVCRLLTDEGTQVVAVVKDEGADISTIKGLNKIHIVYCDMKEYVTLADDIHDSIDAVFHFAWMGSAGGLRRDETIQIKNVEYTLNLINTCKEIRCQRFLFAASVMEFEIEEAIRQKRELSPSMMYSAAKLSCDYMSRILAEKGGIDYIRCIISNVYGPGEISSRLVNSSLRKLLTGKHCSFSPGEQLYDFIYITDAARAFIAAAKYGQPGDSYYIGNNTPRPLKEYLLTMRDLVDSDIEIGIGELEFDGVFLDYTLFDEYLFRDSEFITKVDFETGIKNTINWLREVKDRWADLDV